MQLLSIEALINNLMNIILINEKKDSKASSNANYLDFNYQRVRK